MCGIHLSDNERIKDLLNDVIYMVGKHYHQFIHRQLIYIQYGHNVGPQSLFRTSSLINVNSGSIIDQNSSSKNNKDITNHKPSIDIDRDMDIDDMDIDDMDIDDMDMDK